MGTLLSRYNILTLSLVILALLFFVNGSFSKEKPGEKVVRAAPSIRDVDGYTVRVARFIDGTYGYEIRNGSQVLVHQRRNPFTGSPVGLKDRDDAMKTATWMVKNVIAKEQMLPPNKRLPASILSHRMIPRPVAKQLGIPME